MPAYRFSWDHFDDRTVLELARDLGHRGDASGARSYLVTRCARPNDAFVKDTKATLSRTWLPQHEGIARSVVRDLFEMRIGPMGPPPEGAAACANYVEKCKNTTRLRELLTGRLISYGDAGKESDATGDDEFIPSFAVITPAKQETVQRTPHAHQKDAWSKLDAHLASAGNDGVFKGVLVMPTGSGKTFTATSWLMRNWINKGKRVLWLAHRDELLAQAARAFHEAAALAVDRKQLRIRQVSGRNDRFHMIDPEDHVIVCSVHSLARGGKEARELLHDPRLFVVIDEAHHAPAKSYRDAIELLQQADAHRLLGLTATPTRTAEAERPALRKLFGGNEIYRVSMAELIAKELLARPIPVTVPTDFDPEREMTDEERKHLSQFHEPSADMLIRLGKSEPRNKIIVSHYVANREKYGKTLVFATDVRGAATLKDAFDEAGVRSEYVASYRPDAKDGERVDRRTVLAEYADRKSGLDVLINVEMLTEGVDLPMTRTAFMARPTASEILFRQMAGRALRGPHAGGNREAYIVSFVDHWSSYSDWLSPVSWLAEEEGPVEPPTSPAPPAARPHGELDERLPWDQIRALARAVRARHDGAAVAFEAVPDGMYVLEYEVEDEDVRHVIHMHAHQRPSWEALFAQLKAQPASSLATLDHAALHVAYFADCDLPSVSALDVETVVDRFRAGDPLPEYIALAGRDACDPEILAREAHGKDLRVSEQKALLEARYSPLARVVYPTFLEFRRAFEDALIGIDDPGSRNPPRGVPMFEPPPSNPLRPGPHHDLARLMADTLRQGGELLGQPLTHNGALLWSNRPIKGWYGYAWFRHAERQDEIRINCLLDSPDLSEATLRFLLWHEYLHIHLRSLHTPEFKKLEHLWPNYEACNREMDALNQKFGVQYW